MDDSMRHWGDHDHLIEPVKVIITNINTNEKQDISKEILTDKFFKKLNY